MHALTTIWKQSGQLCGNRLHAFLPLWLEALERTGELALAPEVKVALRHLSPATIDRKLRAASHATPRTQHDAGRQPAQAPNPGTHLRRLE